MNETAENLGLDLERMLDIAAQPTHEWRVYLAALEYIKVGWYLVPISPNSKKLPRADTNINYGSASRKKKTIDKWFHPDDGNFIGYNIGIACGREGGAFVIDVDRHGEIDGQAVLDALQEANGTLPPCPIAKTPNNGFHYYFTWQEHAAQSTGKIGKGIDTRGGESMTCKGHVVAFPSIVNGKMYEWTEMHAVPDIPPWIMEKMGVLWKPRKSKGTGRGNENITDADMEIPIAEPQIITMLDAINPDNLDYDDWLKLGMSVKSQLPGDEGLAIWDEWSKRGKRYKKGECRTRWNGFSDLGTVRGGTLFYLAKKAGWTPDPVKGERGGNPYDQIVAEMNEEYAICAIGGKIRILREKLEIVNEWEMHYDLLDKQAFIDLLSNEVMWSKDDKPVPISKIWLAHPARRTYHNGIGLFPLATTPEGYYNTWNGFGVEPIKGDCTLFLDHLKAVVCDGEIELYEWLITWLADLIQDPGNPKGCAVVMRGGEGCGKGTFANAIGKLFGPHHRHLIDDSHLTSNFNSHLFDAITIFADEITWGGNKKTAGKLKGMVTERYLVGERKGIDAIQYNNRSHLIVASNAEWVIPASFDSRRWFVLDVPSTKVNDFQYFSAIADELDNGGMEALLYHLQRVKLDQTSMNLIRSAPVTAGLKKQRILNTQDDWVLRWWVSILESKKFGVLDIKSGEDNWPESVIKTELYDAYERYCMDRHKPVQVMIAWSTRLIKEFGLTSGKVRQSKNRINTYKIPPVENCIEILGRKYHGILTDDK